MGTAPSRRSGKGSNSCIFILGNREKTRTPPRRNNDRPQGDDGPEKDKLLEQEARHNRDKRLKRFLAAGGSRKATTDKASQQEKTGPHMSRCRKFRQGHGARAIHPRETCSNV